MAKPLQKRALETRARLIAAANAAIDAAGGYEALRVEDVVQRAGVAKGTFFAHFPDKDALMDLLIGARIDSHLDRIENAPPPRDIPELVDALTPLLTLMTAERYVFDLCMRRSGAAAVEEIGPVARSLLRWRELLARWLGGGPFRRDVDPDLLAEGVTAFATQAMAMTFCALRRRISVRDRVTIYLQTWLTLDAAPAAEPQAALSLADALAPRGGAGSGQPAPSLASSLKGQHA